MRVPLFFWTLRAVATGTGLCCGGAAIFAAKTEPPDDLIFESAEPFASGEFRWAFKGHLRTPTGLQRVVIKSFKAEYEAAYPNEGYDAMRAQEKALELAKLYNKAKPRSPPIVFIPVHSYTMKHEIKDETGKVVVRKGQEVMVEPLMDGEFEKFSSNNGWVRNDVMTPGAFSHWTWAHTHELIVCDLQGVRSGQHGYGLGIGSEGTYLLTDPAICSLNKEFGATDGGPRGIDNFFRMHVCNAFCAGFISDRPILKIKDWKRATPTKSTQFMIHETVARSFVAKD